MSCWFPPPEVGGDGNPPLTPAAGGVPALLLLLATAAAAVGESVPEPLDTLRLPLLCRWNPPPRIVAAVKAVCEADWLGESGRFWDRLALS